MLDRLADAVDGLVTPAGLILVGAAAGILVVGAAAPLGVAVITPDLAVLVGTLLVTLVLAVATVRLANATLRLARESTLARLDGLGPQVAIRGFGLSGYTFFRSGNARWDTVLRDTPAWSKNDDGELQIAVQARALLVNEGSRTAEIVIIVGKDMEFSVADGRNRGLTAQRGAYLLPPGEEASLAVQRGKLMRDWVADWESASGRPPVADSHLTIRAVSSGTSAVLDEVNLTFGAFAIVPDATTGAWLPPTSISEYETPPTSTVVDGWVRQYRV